MDPASKRNPETSRFSSSLLLRALPRGPKTRRNGLHESRAPPKKVADAHMQVKAMVRSMNIGSSLPGKQPEKLNQRHPDAQKPRSEAGATAGARKSAVSRTKSVEGDGKKKGGEIVGEGGGDDGKRLGLVDGGGFRRRSFCGSDLDLGGFLSGVGAKVVAEDMPPLMQIHAVSSAKKTHDSLEKFSSKGLAFSLKKEFDTVYGPAWHCIIGSSFGSFVTHSVGGFIYFFMGKFHILLFKTAVQRAE